MEGRIPASAKTGKATKARITPALCASGKTKTKINPLQRMGLRPAVRLPVWSYKSKLLVPTPKA